MAIYEITSDKFRRIDETSLCHAGLRERRDSQRLLRSQIEIDSPNTLIKSVLDFAPTMVTPASSPYGTSGRKAKRANHGSNCSPEHSNR